MRIVRSLWGVAQVSAATVGVIYNHHKGGTTVEHSLKFYSVTYY